MGIPVDVPYGIVTESHVRLVLCYPSEPDDDREGGDVCILRPVVDVGEIILVEAHTQGHGLVAAELCIGVDPDSLVPPVRMDGSYLDRIPVDGVVVDNAGFRTDKVVARVGIAHLKQVVLDSRAARFRVGQVAFVRPDFRVGRPVVVVLQVLFGLPGKNEVGAEVVVVSLFAVVDGEQHIVVADGESDGFAYGRLCLVGRNVEVYFRCFALTSGEEECPHEGCYMDRIWFHKL